MMHRRIVLAEEATLVKAKKMKGRFDAGGGKRDGGSDGEEAYKSDYGIGKRALTRRRFVKTSVAVGAAAAGIPFNLTDITDIALKEDGELLIYPVIYEYQYEFPNGERPWFKRIISVKLFGCDWNCKECPTKFYPSEGKIPMIISVDQIVDLLLSLNDDPETLLLISGGEPLLQNGEVLKLIDSLKNETNYTVMLHTNGSLIEDDFVNKANDTSLDGIVIKLFGLDAEWHKWYTGYSNKDTIKALKLVTERFSGLSVVDLILHPQLDMTTLENMYVFLYEINPNFVITICPCHHKHIKYNDEKRVKAEEISMQYFWQIDRTLSLSKQYKMTRYLIVKDESGHIDLSKNTGWSRIKNGGEFIKVD